MNLSVERAAELLQMTEQETRNATVSGTVVVVNKTGITIEKGDMIGQRTDPFTGTRHWCVWRKNDKGQTIIIQGNPV